MKTNSRVKGDIINIKTNHRAKGAHHGYPYAVNGVTMIRLD